MSIAKWREAWKQFWCPHDGRETRTDAGLDQNGRPQVVQQTRCTRCGKGVPPHSQTPPEEIYRRLKQARGWRGVNDV